MHSTGDPGGPTQRHREIKSWCKVSEKAARPQKMRSSSSSICFGVVLVGLLGGLSLLTLSTGFEEPLIGWKGETYNPSHKWKHADKKTKPRSKSSIVSQDWVVHNTSSTIRGQVLSWKPRVFYYPDFLSPEECDHLIRSAIPTLKKSVVFDADGKLVVDDIRTSYGTFLRRLQDDIVINITSRVAEVTHVPVSHQEDLQILRYAQNEYYQAHYDSSQSDGSRRHSTVLLYLTDVEEGGETSFPHTGNINPEFAEQNGPYSACATGHLSVKPRKGDAILFYTFSEDVEMDKLARHMGCPVLKGTKWTGTIWTHQRPYSLKYFHRPLEKEAPADPGICMDYYKECSRWASTGECQKNQAWMEGDGGNTLGNCRKSCKACELCTKGDKECYTNNRRQAGYLTLPELFETGQWNNEVSPQIYR